MTPLFQIVNNTLGQPLCSRVTVAQSAWARARGLIGRPRLAPGEGLLLDPCQGVHMFFMRYPIDVIFLDGALTVVAVQEGLKPWRVTRIYRSARAVLEVPAGTVAETGLAVGHRLTLVESGPA